jgi:hypothetical protein
MNKIKKKLMQFITTHNIKADNKTTANVIKFKYFGAKLLNRILILYAPCKMSNSTYLSNFSCTEISTICVSIVFNFGE